MTEPVKNQELFFNAMKPAYREDYLAESARLGYKPAIALDMDYVRGDAILARNESDGKQRYVIPRSAVVWTAELYKSTLITDAELAALPKVPQEQALVDTVVENAKIGKIVAIFSEDTTAITVTAEGTTYMMIARQHLRSPHVLGVLYHEAGHAAAGDHLPEAMAKKLNASGDQHLQMTRAEEDRADLYAVKKCYGPQLIAALTERHADEVAVAAKKGISVDEHYARDTHTSGLERIANAKEAMRKAVAQGLCKATEATLSEEKPSVPELPASGAGLKR